MNEAAAYYRRAQPGLADVFLSALERAAGHISERPLAGRVVAVGIRSSRESWAGGPSASELSLGSEHRPQPPLHQSSSGHPEACGERVRTGQQGAFHSDGDDLGALASARTTATPLGIRPSLPLLRGGLSERVGDELAIELGGHGVERSSPTRR
jgi:hypothetical protein